MGIWLSGIAGLLVTLSTIAATAIGLVAIESHYEMRGDDK